MIKRCLALMLSSVLVAPAIAAAQQPKAGVVTVLEGNVSARRVALPGPLPLKLKDEVFLQDTVATGDQSLARMFLGGKAVVTVRERSILTITEVPGKSTIDLESGKFALAVAREKMRPGEEIQIRTPNAVAGVRGTVVITEVTRQSAQIGGAAPAVRTNFYVLSGTITAQLLDPGTRRPVGVPLSVGAMQRYQGAGLATPTTATMTASESTQAQSGLKPSGPKGGGEAGKEQVKAQAVRTATTLVTALTGGPTEGQAAQAVAPPQKAPPSPPPPGASAPPVVGVDTMPPSASMPGLQFGASAPPVVGDGTGRGVPVDTMPPSASMPGLQFGASAPPVVGVDTMPPSASMPGLQFGASAPPVVGVDTKLSSASMPGLRFGASAPPIVAVGTFGGVVADSRGPSGASAPPILAVNNQIVRAQELSNDTNVLKAVSGQLAGLLGGDVTLASIVGSLGGRDDAVRSEAANLLRRLTQGGLSSSVRAQLEATETAITAPLLRTVTGSGLDTTGARDFVLAGGKIGGSDGTDPFLSFTGGTHKILSFSILHAGGGGGATTSEVIETCFPPCSSSTLTLGTGQPLVRSGSGPFFEASSGATITIDGGGLHMDTALLSASAPLLSLRSGASLTTAAEGINLANKAKLTAIGPIVKIDGSTLTIGNGSAINVAGGSFLNITSGDLISMIGGTLNISNGALLKVAGGSVVKVSGGLVNFNSTTATINLTNSVCSGSCAVINGVKFFFTNSGTSANVSVSNTFKNSGNATINLSAGANTAHVIIDGATSKLIVSGN